MKTQSSLNGVDTEQLMRTVEDIKATPALAVFKFRANNKWLNGGHNRSVIKSFSGNGQENKEWQLDNDEPPVLLGTDHAPNPVEYILHGLAGCLTTSLVYHASARGISIESVESTLEGEIDLHGFLGLSEEKRLPGNSGGIHDPRRSHRGAARGVDRARPEAVASIQHLN